MNDHNLADLVVETIEPQNNKAKSALTIVALLIVVLIVGIIFAKTIFNDSNNNETDLVEDTTEMISPDLTPHNVTSKKKEKEEPELSDIIESTLNEFSIAPKITKIEKPVVVKKEIVETVKIEKPKVEKVKEEVFEAKSVEITKEFDQSQLKPKAVETPKVIEKPKVVVAPKVEKKAPAPKGKPAPVKKKAPEVVTLKPTSKQIYYIQVGSFKNTPSSSSRLLRSVKNNGFKYKVRTIGNMKKVHIGPFYSRDSANTALVRVRDRINKGAYVVKK